jgi:hypothetical protein
MQQKPKILLRRFGVRRFHHGPDCLDCIEQQVDTRTSIAVRITNVQSYLSVGKIFLKTFVLVYETQKLPNLFPL